MKQQRPECAQCREPMKRGFGLDNTYGGVLRTHWAEGLPKRSWLLGTRVKREDKLPITMFRCPRCGRLESYAWPDSSGG